MDYIITTEQLTKKYKNFTSVNHVSLHIRKGSIYGFLGPNGAGTVSYTHLLLDDYLKEEACMKYINAKDILPNALVKE